MAEIYGSWPVTGYVPLINNPIVASDYFIVEDTAKPGTASLTFVDSAPDGGPVTLTAQVTDDGLTLSGNGVVGNYAYYVTAMVETVGAPMLYRTISGVVLRKGGGTEDSGGQWGGGPLKPK